MVTNLSQLQVGGRVLTEQWVDTLAVVSSLTCNAMGIAAARVTDTLRGHMKVSIIGCLALATLTFTALSLVSLGVFHISSFVMLQVWVASLLIVGQCFTVMAAPLLLEFTVEICYPVSEVISGGASFLGYGLGSMVFLLIFLIP